MPNNTGMPDNLKTGIEKLSGFSLDDVKVHYNSSKPAQVQAHAYAQGSNIYLAPGDYSNPHSETGMRAIAHEAAHVVQMAQGRVQATTELGSVAINDNSALEAEADTLADNVVKSVSKG